MDVKYKMIDVSYHNGDIDFSKVKADGIQGVIIRAGYGNSNIDTKFHEYMKGAIQNGLHIGIYWFGYASNVEQAKFEAELCNKTISQYKGYIDFPVYYDWEYDSYNYIKKTYNITATKELVSSITQEFCKTMESYGWWSGFYANIDYLNNFYTDTVKSRFACWVAQWSSKCSYSGQYGIWQYGAETNKIDSKTVNGISSSCVDKDYCYIDYPNLIKSSGLNGYGSISNSTSSLTENTYPIWSDVKTFSYLKDKDTFLSPHFQVKEFGSVSNGKLYSDDVLISYDLVQMLETLYEKLNCTSIVINSGYRTAEHDKTVGGSGTGQHTLGKACDIVCRNANGVISAKIVCCVASDIGFKGVANISNRYQATHVDVRNSGKYYGDEVRGNSSIWNYNSAWTDFYTYFGLTKSDVAQYTG